jgi:Uma2 family endonuclease
MSTRSIDYRDAVDHLPEGAALLLQDVSWDDYEQLLNDLADRPGLRLTYDAGKLWIMSPSLEHEEYKEFIAQVIYVLRDELDINVEPRGSTTWKKKRDAKGTEPDTCFYVANADRIIGKRTIDLSVDPPPDLAVEIDVTNESLTKFSIYATLGVPEIWRYESRDGRVFMYELRDQIYVEIPLSRSFPILTGAALTDFLEQSKTLGHKAALLAFRQWIKKTISGK